MRGRHCAPRRARVAIELYARAYWRYYTVAALWVGATGAAWPALFPA